MNKIGHFHFKTIMMFFFLFEAVLDLALHYTCREEKRTIKTEKRKRKENKKQQHEENKEIKNEILYSVLKVIDPN